MSEKKATRPGSKWAHGKRRVLPMKHPRSAGRDHCWHAGARVRVPR